MWMSFIPAIFLDSTCNHLPIHIDFTFLNEARERAMYVKNRTFQTVEMARICFSKGYILFTTKKSAHIVPLHLCVSRIG